MADTTIPVEALILDISKWGSRDAPVRSNVTGRKGVITQLMMSLEGATDAQRTAATSVLFEKYGISAGIRPSASAGTDVLLVENNGPYHEVGKLQMACHMANPDKWQGNEIEKSDGSKHPALNLDLTGIADEQLKYGQTLLKKWSIPSEVKESRSLAVDGRNVRVLRIEGAENIAALQDKISSIANANQGKPLPVPRPRTLT